MLRMHSGIKGFLPFTILRARCRSFVNAKIYNLIFNERKKNRNITIKPFTFTFYVVNIVLYFSYHHYNFRTHAKFFRSIEKIMIVTADAYSH